MTRRVVQAPVRLARGLVWWLRSVLGDHDYARYCEHRRLHHPGEPLPSEREYWRERYAAQERNPGARCC